MRGPTFIIVKSSAVKANGYVERLILCVIKGSVIVAISLSWILPRGACRIPWAFQCFLDTLHHVCWRGSFCGPGETRPWELAGWSGCCLPKWWPGGTPTRGTPRVSRLESLQATESVLGVIPSDGMCTSEGKPLSSPGLCSAPGK